MGKGVRDLATEFEAERDHLMAVAYRMLGSRADAEDAVQETWLRYARTLADPAARAEIRELRAWLTTATGRICLDLLRSARVRREAYPGQWLPEPVVSRLPDLPGLPRPATATTPTEAGGFAPDPAERAALRDEVGIALLVVLERLTPEQRVAFVLHDVFAVPFAEIATVLHSTPIAARQLASRARRAVAEGGARHTADLAEQHRVLAAFIAATESGDLERLVTVLAPDVVFVGDSGGHLPAARNPVVGVLKVARLTLGLLDRTVRAVDARTRPVLVNGTLGLQVEGDYRGRGRLRMVTWYTIADGRITGIFHQLNPEKLSRVTELGPDAPSWPPRP
ncbi:RNA polymerase sigma factor SigJ [Micromonospora sp. NPDC050417]|uniref:RNA polymerase sigma factor SigJ n=1 Tax=Micromonospora sp. NPDC050417 TaxID=3364280 RepID=UPI00378B8523